MLEILTTIIGVILGAFASWLIQRRKPTYVPFEIQGSTGIILKLPDTKITYRDIALEELYLTRIRAYNAGTQVIENDAKFIIKTYEDSNILGATAEILPEREEAECRTKTERGKVEVVTNKLLPYSLNHESLYINIFSDSKLTIKQVEGYGVFRDGTVWGALSPKNQIRWIPGYGYFGFPATRREAILLAITIIAFLGVIATIILSFLYNSPANIIHINHNALQLWFNSFWAWLLIGSLAGFIFWSIAMGFHGWILRIPIPLTGYVVDIRFVKIRRKDEISEK